MLLLLFLSFMLLLLLHKLLDLISLSSLKISSLHFVSLFHPLTLSLYFSLLHLSSSFLCVYGSSYNTHLESHYQQNIYNLLQNACAVDSERLLSHIFAYIFQQYTLCISVPLLQMAMNKERREERCR